ncbi:MAG: hypothetical protein IIC67_05510 [Thaumarchaeota archaeon]|nr:hypothetical protein [Nitrososphaerota archaeon]
MKFDGNGRRVRGYSNVQTFNGLSPELSSELTSLGIENSSLSVIADMTSSENSGKAFEIILKMARSHNKFPVGPGRNF